MKHNLLIESNFDTEVLSESSTGKKNWFIKGIFMQEDVNNRNGRRYPKHIMENEINRYIKESVMTRSAVGELCHPESPIPDLKNVSHIIEEILHEGRNYIGKAKILNTPMGNIVTGLLEGGVRLGVSSRGTGSLVEDSDGVKVVQPDFKLSTVDIVYNPSAPDAFVQGLMEGHSFVWNTLEEDTQFKEKMKEKIKKTPSAKLQEEKIAAFEKFMNRIKGM